MSTNLEILLSEWGHLQSGANRSGLGFPSETSFSKMRVDCARTNGDANVLMVDDALRKVDAAIAALHPDTRAVVVAHYVWPGPVKVKVDRLGVSRTSYYDTLDFTHKHLSHHMGGSFLCGYETKVSGHLAAVSG